MEPESDARPEAEAEALIPKFQVERILNQGESSRASFLCPLNSLMLLLYLYNEFMTWHPRLLLSFD